MCKRNRKRRLEFVNEYLIKGFNFWKEIIFTDENKFNVFHSNGKITTWRRLNKEFEIKNLNFTVKHGSGSLMVGTKYMSASGVGVL